MLISATDIITKSWELYRKHWRQLGVYLLLLFIPTLFIFALSALGTRLNDFFPSSTVITNIILLIIFVASLVFNLWTYITLLHATKSLLLEQTAPDWKLSFNSTSHLIGPFIYTSILTALAVLGGTLLLIIPGIIFSVWYSFVTLVVVVEGKTGIKAMRLSKNLVAGRWWSIAWRIFLPNALFALLSFILTALVSLPLILISSPDIKEILDNGLSAIVSTLIAPLSAAATMLLYLNAKQNPTATTTNDSEPPV